MAGDSGKVARPAAKKAVATLGRTPEPAEVAPGATPNSTVDAVPAVDGDPDVDSTLYTVKLKGSDDLGVSVPNDVADAEVGDYIALALDERGVDADLLESFETAELPASGAVTPEAGSNVPEVPDSVDTDPGLDPEALARLANGDPDEEPVIPEPANVAPFLSGREHVFSDDGDRFLVLGAIFGCWVDGNYRAADKGDVVIVDPSIAEKSLSKGYLLALDDIDYES